MSSSAQNTPAARQRIVVIGGSAAGPKAAARARRLDETAAITILQKAPDLSMASCGYPYYVGGFFDDRNMLLCSPTGVVRDPRFFLKAKGIVARTGVEATRIDRAARLVEIRDLQTGATEEVPYDKLILATGARPRLPPVPGVELAGVTTLQSMQDADFLRRVRDERRIRKAVIIGGGLIGVETCEALHLAGLEITVVELLPQLLTFLDWQLAKLVENHVRAKGARVITDDGVTAFLGEDGQLRGVRLRSGAELDCELAVVAIGVIPNSGLAAAADLALGATGGILVDEHLRTSDPDIYAAGDCLEITQLVSGAKVHAPFGDLSNLQGRVAGENAVLGDVVIFPGTIQTGICKIFDYAAGSTGLSERAATAAGFEVETVVTASPDKPGFMQGKLLVTKLVAERATGRILGAQCLGPGDVSKQLAVWAMAVRGKLTVDEMANADLPYAPPFSLAIDHGIAAAHVLQNKLKGRMRGISAVELHQRLASGDRPFLLDVRNPNEFEEVRLGAGERLIPLGLLRDRLAELPADKSTEIVCYCKISLRGYEAARVLQANGWERVLVLEGGLMAWPYPLER
ncbi:MAG: FAD-dependent oxidoreductase [Myxococcota bacterium]|jgi:NADPH-dependent 2,4-dienoyl-CoA reductase/sulfur reductase-like enzyme/rhodanese-related sulfurtransferase|nr:FAD-dependent oxidoreductase [Myxococcota bacterium]